MSSSRIRKVGLLFLTLLMLLVFACHKKTVPAPPPRPPAPPAAPAPPAPTITLRANPTTLYRSQSTTLTWEARNATSVQIEPGVGIVPAMGNRSLSPTSSVTYQATAMGPGGTATDTARITVNFPPPPPFAPAESLK